jgi:hypothetical protein
MEDLELRAMKRKMKLIEINFEDICDTDLKAVKIIHDF